jgi:hypothetical protein
VLPDGTIGVIATSSSWTILEFAPGTIGNVAPIRSIGGSMTGLNDVSYLAADAAGTIYAVNDFTVTEYPENANGNVARAAAVTLTQNPYSVAVLPSAILQ